MPAWEILVDVEGKVDNYLEKDPLPARIRGR
jgi:hypothetical protein